MTTHEELRARLTQASVDDLEATYALYLDAKEARSRVNLRNDQDLAEVLCRIDRLFAQSVRIAQATGKLRDRHGKIVGDTAPVLKINHLVPPSTMNTLYRCFDGVSEELFEEALSKCKADGRLSRQTLGVKLEELRNSQPPAKSTTRMSARTRRTIEHLAIQMDALARGVEELNPEEVDRQVLYHAITKVYVDMGVIKAFLRKVN